MTYCLPEKYTGKFKSSVQLLMTAYSYFKNSVGLETVLCYRRILGKKRFVTGTRLDDGDYLIVISAGEVDLEQYALRWGIETMFGSLKTRGFHLEDTHVSDPERLSTLLALLCVAYNWVGAFGNWVFTQAKLRCLKHGRAPICRFRLGLDALQNWAISLCRTVNDLQRQTVLQFLSCT